MRTLRPWRFRSGSDACKRGSVTRFPRGSPSSERGSATITAAATIGAMLVVLLGLLLVFGVMVARGRAQTAADLGALAGTRSLLDGGGSPCGVAADVVRANGGEVGACEVAGETVTVTARVPVVWLGRSAGFHAGAVARAGPGP
ncbi:MAG TPA: flp pilus-assembly TadE/G-like family protein [Actinomycetales bacterium]|nr:flp pilus-assembly TadE/G-like family protein [Actinomycetales bacterium]